MSNKNLFKEAIADAKAVREAALANAKAALEEALTPKLQSMLAAKLNEMEYEEEELEEKKSKKEMEEVDMMSPVDTDDEIQDRARAASAALEENEELEEDFDLSEILAELNEAEEKEEEKEEEETEETEEEEGEEEVEVKDMTIEDLKDLIKDIVSQEIEAETPSMDMGAEEESEEVVDMGGEEMAAGAEDEIDLEELLAELDSLDEADDKEEMDEAKKKETKKEKEEKKSMKEAIDPELLGAIGGVAGLFGVAGGIAKLMLNSAKKEIADRFKKAGKPVPSDKELSKLAAAGLKGSLDQATGGASLGQSTTGKGSGLGVQEELEEAISTINTLRSELNEVNLLNAKLLYVNKIFKAKNLTESQKVKVIASFDKATNVKEAKVVFESLESALTAAPKKAIKESLGFASKAAGVAPNKTIVESNDVISRMQKLANIK